MNISMAFDEKYSPYAYTTILSLFTNNPAGEICLYILESDLSDVTKASLKCLGDTFENSIELVHIDKAAMNQKLPVIEKWPIEVYYRLLLPELLPEDADRVIYLDSDMIINTSLKELYEEELEDYDLAGCYDMSLKTATLDMFLYNRSPQFSALFESKRYINSGMILFNLRRMRQEYTFETYIRALDELEGRIYAPDQDLINFVHQEKIKHLDPRKYNFPGYMVYNEIPGNEAAKASVPIIHFICEKPWQGGNHVHYATEQIWWDYALGTPYRDALLEQYVRESIKDPTMIKITQGTDEVKQALSEENARLKRELSEAMENVKRVIAMFEHQSP